MNLSIQPQTIMKVDEKAKPPKKERLEGWIVRDGETQIGWRATKEEAYKLKAEYAKSGAPLPNLKYTVEAHNTKIKERDSEGEPKLDANGKVIYKNLRGWLLRAEDNKYTKFFEVRQDALDERERITRGRYSVGSGKVPEPESDTPAVGKAKADKGRGRGRPAKQTAEA